jgi:hypothetical protein
MFGLFRSANAMSKMPETLGFFDRFCALSNYDNSNVQTDFQSITDYVCMIKLFIDCMMKENGQFRRIFKAEKDRLMMAEILIFRASLDKEVALPMFEMIKDN